LLITAKAWRSGFCALAFVSESHFAKPVLYEGGISRTTLSSKHVKEKRKNERGNFKKT